MINWTIVSSVATGAGTLVLAVATFASVRSANRAARVAERALLENVRPLLTPSRLDDPRQKIFYQEGKHVVLDGGRGAAKLEHGVVYLAISLRGAGRGIAVLHGWRFQAGRELNPQRPDPEAFRHQGRDIFIAPGDIGFWQGTFRDEDDPQYAEAVAAVTGNEVLTIDLLYGDTDGGQRVISRMMLQRFAEGSVAVPERDAAESMAVPQRGADGLPWLASVVRHWNVDRADPR